MNDNIITVEEVVNEMMNGKIVRVLKDKGTFFVYHKANNLIYMILYDQITNRMCIAPIDSPSNIKNGKNTFLQGYYDNKIVITTFFEMFNELHIPSFCFSSNLDDADKMFKDVKFIDDSSMYKSNFSDRTYPIKKEDK